MEVQCSIAVSTYMNRICADCPGILSWSELSYMLCLKCANVYFDLDRIVRSGNGVVMINCEECGAEEKVKAPGPFEKYWWSNLCEPCEAIYIDLNTKEW